MKALMTCGVVAIALLGSPIDAAADCVEISAPSLVASGEAYTLRWTPFPGASGYEVVTAFVDGQSRTVRRELVRQPQITLAQIVTVPQKIRATVTPLDVDDVCHESVVIDIAPDERLREMSRRTIVPVVASAPGAFGASFRSAVTVSNVSGSPLTGRLVFHPAGRPHADDHPSLAFSVGINDSVSWSDVVAAIGAQGLGSLDIIIDETNPSSRQQRRELINVSTMAINDDGQAVWGADVPAYVPLELSGYNLVDLSENWYLTVPDPGAEGRVNVGWRAVDLGTLDGPDAPSIRWSLYRDGALLGSIDMTLQQGEMNQVPGDSIFGTPLQPGDRITAMARGSVLPWLTWTSNVTNDPAFFPGRRLRVMDPVAIPLLPDDTVDVIPHELTAPHIE